MKNWEYYFDKINNRRDLETKTKIQEKIDQGLYNEFLNSNHENIPDTNSKLYHM